MKSWLTKEDIREISFTYLIGRQIEKIINIILGTNITQLIIGVLIGFF